MAVALQAKTYPHIGSDPEIADGKPIIVGTRITVRCIGGYYQMGMSADEILTTLPHLTPSEVHSAIRKPQAYENRVIFGRRCTFSVSTCLAQQTEKTNQTDQTNAHNVPNVRNLRSRQASQAQADCFSAVSSGN